MAFERTWMNRMKGDRPGPEHIDSRQLPSPREAIDAPEFPGGVRPRLMPIHLDYGLSRTTFPTIYPFSPGFPPRVSCELCPCG
jgi:hypothetical protein